MKKAFILFLYSTLFACAGHAQSLFSKQWDKDFGGTNWDYLYSLQQTADGGYIIGGGSYSDSSGDKSQNDRGDMDFWIIKTDGLGNKQWDKTFGGTSNDQLAGVYQLKDGGYILGGGSYSGIGGDRTQASWGSWDFWLVKTDSLGNKLWDKAFGGTGDDEMMSLNPTNDGGCILGGITYSGVGGDKTSSARGGLDYWVVKVDSLGNKEWDKDFGGTDDDWLYGVQQTRDGGYILGGYSDSGIGGDKTQATKGGFDYWIVKIDALGNKQWDKDLGGTGGDQLYSLQQTTDGGYISGGLSGSGVSGDKSEATWGNSDYWMVKVDSLGNKQWDKDFGGTGNGEDEFGSVIQTADSGYLLAGNSYAPISGDKTEQNLGYEQTWIVKTDLNGNKQWDKTIFTTGHDETSYAIQATDGCYLAGNNTSAGSGGYKTEDTKGFRDIWIIKFCDSTLAIAPPPVADFSSSDSVVCANNCIKFSDLSSNATSWKWTFAGGSPSSSTDQNPQVCYLSSGTYGVAFIASNSGGSDTLTLNNYITVDAAPPTPVIEDHPGIGNDTLVFKKDSSYISYQWYDDSTVIAGATDTFLVVYQNGNYNVAVTNANDCKISVGINVIIGLQNYMNDHVISLWPNPAGNELRIKSGELRIGEVEIYNVLGQVVASTPTPLPLLRRGESAVIDVSGLSSGIYFVQVVGEKERWVGRFVKE